jgi:PAS domain S-box-containing protein
LKPDQSGVRVLVVEDGLTQPDFEGMFDSSAAELVRAGSMDEARELLRSQRFDVLVTNDAPLRGMLDALFVFVGLFSPDGVVVDVNQAPLTGSGLRRDQVVGHRFVEMPWFAHSVEERARISAAIATASAGEPVRLQTRIWSTRGLFLWIDASFSPLRDDRGAVTHVVGSGVDITARKKAEEAQHQMQEELRALSDRLRALGARLDSVREEERRGMAREVHDQIGQALTALKLDLGWVRKQVADKMNGAVVARLTGMEGLIDQTLETARRVSADLRPAILDDLGLGAAIAWQSREFEKRTGIACTLELPSERPRLPAPAAVALFRIVQEALTNVARHAGAVRVWIRLEVTEQAATLTVTDDGRGAGSDELGRPSALGVLGMRERALVLGGSVTITGTPGAGTAVVARIPIAPTENGG